MPASALPSTTGSIRTSDRRALLVVLGIVLLLRLVHLASAINSPLTYQLGPDEDFYLQFGRDVATGSGGMDPQYAFMDPLYGYLLGGVFKLLGPSPFPVYLLQIAVDTGTALALYLIGRALGRPRVGLGAALVFGFTGTALAFSMSLLKATWVAGYLTLWTLLAIHLLRDRRWPMWLAFGVYCGIGVALRANLLLLMLPAIGFVPALAWWSARGPRRRALAAAAALALGMALPLSALSLRNHALSDYWSPVPNNGGVVLHQLYNPENPRSASGAPSFVRYGHPAEIWRSYVGEAQRRLGRSLTPGQVNAYWRTQATAYLRAHPLQSLQNALRKLAEFSAYPEVPNNRAYADERLFSPILRVLPQPFGWLFALGLPGLLLLAWRDRRALLLLAPVAVGMATIAIFFAEDRFRFNILPPFALGTSALAAAIWHWTRTRAYSKAIAAALLATALGALSVWNARLIPHTPTNWQRIATGYVRMNDLPRATRWVERIAAQQPDAVGVEEFRGYFALRAQRYGEAVRHYRRALAQRSDRHEVLHNYSLSLQGAGDIQSALAAERRAFALAPLDDYRCRLVELLRLTGHFDEAVVFSTIAGEKGSTRCAAIAH